MENTIIITGRLGDDPETKDKGRGPYVRASLAHSQGHYDKQARQWVEADTPTAWFTITANGKTGDQLSAMHKGDMIIVVGAFSVDEWEPQDGTHSPIYKRKDLRIWANSVALVYHKAGAGQAPATGYAAAPAAPATAQPGPAVPSSELWETYTEPEF